MAVSSYKLFLYNNGKQVTESKTLEMLLTSVSVSADGGVTNTLTIKESGSAPNTFDFGGKKLGNIATPTANGQALVYDMLGANSGIATLDSGGKVPVTQLPSSVMTYEGVWNATTNSPSLADGTGDAGMVYRVSTGGTQDLGSGSITFGVGDYVIYNGTIWEKSDSTDAVVSVNGQTGVVSLDTDDVSQGSTNLYYSSTSAKADAIAAALTGFSAASGGTVVATDTVLQAFGKLEYRVALNDAKVSYSASTARSDLIASSITDGDTTHAPSGEVVYEALLLKANAADVGADKYVSLTNKEASAITVRQFVKMLVAGEVTLLTSTDAITEETFLGCVKDASIAADAAGNIYIPEAGAVISGFTGLDVTKLVYAHATTAGDYTQTRPTTGKVIILGRAIASDKIVFIGKIDFVYA